MKSSVTISFTVLFLVVVAAYLWLKPQNTTKIIEGPPQVMRLLFLEENDEIVLIEIDNKEKDQVITLALENGTWYLKHPVFYEADPVIVHGLVAALTMSFRERRLKPEKGWEEYGLEKPRMRISIETKQSHQRRSLYLGDTSPVGRFIYGRWEGEKEYFLLAPEIKSAFERTVYSLRQKKIFRGNLENLVKIQVMVDREPYELSRRNGTWYWVEPIEVLGEKVALTHIKELITQMEGLYIKDFLDEAQWQRRDAGVEAARNSITLFYEKDTSEQLILAKEMPKRDAYYGIRKDEDVLFLVARDNIRHLFQVLETAALEAKAEAAKREVPE